MIRKSEQVIDLTRQGAKKELQQKSFGSRSITFSASSAFNHTPIEAKEYDSSLRLLYFLQNSNKKQRILIDKYCNNKKMRLFSYFLKKTIAFLLKQQKSNKMNI